MTIEEKYKSAVDLLTNLYLAGHKESVEVGNNILQENGLGGRDFWEVICLRLKSEGFLKEYYDINFFPEFLYKNKAEEIQSKLWRLESFRGEEKTGSSVFNPLFVHDKWSRKVLNEYKELEEQEPKLKEELEAIPKVCRFVVNGNKIAQRNIDYTDTASRKAWERKWNILQSIWTVYKSNNDAREISIPTEELALTEPTKPGVDGILNGLKDAGCFGDWIKDNKNYYIQDIDEHKLTNYYRETGNIYKKFAEVFKERQQKAQEDHIERQGKIDAIRQVEYNYKLLSPANKKKLCVLEKLKNEFDLAPKNNNKITIPWSECINWEDECGINYQQLENILSGFQEEGLLTDSKLYPPYV